MRGEGAGMSMGIIADCFCDLSVGIELSVVFFHDGR